MIWTSDPDLDVALCGWLQAGGLAGPRDLEERARAIRYQLQALYGLNQKAHTFFETLAEAMSHAQRWRVIDEDALAMMGLINGRANAAKHQQLGAGRVEAQRLRVAGETYLRRWAIKDWAAMRFWTFDLESQRRLMSRSLTSPGGSPSVTLGRRMDALQNEGTWTCRGPRQSPDRVTPGDPGTRFPADQRDAVSRSGYEGFMDMEPTIRSPGERPDPPGARRARERAAGEAGTTSVLRDHYGRRIVSIEDF